MLYSLNFVKYVNDKNNFLTVIRTLNSARRTEIQNLISAQH
jgi:hypothetical protein